MEDMLIFLLQSLDEKLRSASTKEAEVSFFELKISELTSKVAELQKQNQDLNEKLTSLTSANSEIQTKLTHATEQAQKFESQSATQKIESQQKLKQTNKFYLSKFTLLVIELKLTLFCSEFNQRITWHLKTNHG